MPGSVLAFEKQVITRGVLHHFYRGKHPQSLCSHALHRMR